MSTELNEKIKISSKTNYHIYVLRESDCNLLMKNKNCYISFFVKNQNMKKKDVIILYQKQRMKNGFYGIVQLREDLKYNEKKIKVFSDLNMNRFYARVCYRSQFTELINPEIVVHALSSGATGFKNVTSFKQKYVGKINASIEFELHGKKIMTQLLIKDEELILMTETESQQETEEAETEEAETEEAEIEEKKPKKKKPKSKSKSKSKPKPKEEDVDEVEEIVEQKCIPIMVVPCKTFKFPEISREDYFVKHYKSCKKCETTNNNDGLEIISLLEENNIEIYELNDYKHYYFDPALDAYYSSDFYEPPDLMIKPFVRVIYINNKHDVYNKCLLITATR
jgi:predicted nucleic-acid-binding Zn-ribbon protein